MKARIDMHSAAWVPGLLLAALPGRAWACAACFGQSDSPLAEGMNWGIFALLVVIAGVMVGVASFFVFLARRSGSASALPPEAGASPSP